MLEYFLQNKNLAYTHFAIFESYVYNRSYARAEYYYAQLQMLLPP